MTPLYRLLSVLCSVALCALLGSAPAWAASVFYKWVDETGATQFTSTPPPGNIPYEKVSTGTSDPSQGEAGRAALEERIKQSDLQRKAEGRKAAQKEEEAEIAAEKERLCSQARKRLTSVTTYPRVSRTLPDGTVVRLGEEERQAAIAEAQKYLQDNNC